MLKGRILLVLGAVMTALCITSLIHMFVLRYASGDVYAAYSSLRADPKGCKVLCESLGRLHGVTVTRNLRDLSRWSGTESGKTIVFAGYNLWWFEYQEPEDVQRLFNLAAAGNRVVVSLAPTTMLNAKDADKEAAEKIEDFVDVQRKMKGERPKEEEKEEVDDSPVARGVWGVEMQFSPLPKKEEDRYVIFAPSEESDEMRIPWNTTAAFTHPDELWSIVGSRDGKPIVLERDIGEGSLVLCADSYFLSNEAQLRERSTRFVLWLLGPHRDIVFDETHHGIASQPGIASLIRQYRLHGLMGGLVLLAGLFVWKNLFSLVPRREEDPTATEVEGKDQTEGLVNLLQHHVLRRNLIQECERVWRKSIRFLPHLGPARQEEVRIALASQLDATPETKYQRIQQILNKRN